MVWFSFCFHALVSIAITQLKEKCFLYYFQKKKSKVFSFSPCLIIKVLKNAFDAFDQEKNGFISVTMVGTILGMLGHQLDEKMLNEIVAEVDEDGSGQIEFEEFCTLAARFLVEEDAEAMQQELVSFYRLSFSF